ncbi:MAG: low molecular weight phosphotyrosine protein phosphatase [Hyphomicrobiales bacterium]
MFQVLVVCTGNTCRSPMAEGILRSLLTPELDGHVTVVSAGTSAMEGVPATARAVETAAASGIDLRQHRARRLGVEILQESDLVICMEPSHIDAAKALVPGIADRIHLITRHGAESRGAGATGVADPIGGGADEYADTFHRIRSHLLRWVPVIREAVARSEGVR